MRGVYSDQKYGIINCTRFIKQMVPNSRKQKTTRIHSRVCHVHILILTTQVTCLNASDHVSPFRVSFLSSKIVLDYRTIPVFPLIKLSLLTLNNTF